jgi:AAA family ATP:ADP antiporter
LVEQYWSLINSTLSAEEAKTFNGPIIGCTSIGPILAGLFLNKYAATFGTELFLLFAAAALIPAALFSWTAYQIAGEPQPKGKQTNGGEGDLNLKLFTTSRTLLFLAIIVGLSQVVATMLSLRFYGLLEAGIQMKDARTAYLGGFWSTINTVSFVLQFIFTPLLLKYARIRFIHIAIPLLHLTACAALFITPSLAVAAGAVILFKGLDYSFFRASKEVLYIPLSYDARYRAKQVIDSFSYRLAKGGSAGFISVLTASVGNLPSSIYAITAGAAAIIWAGCAVPLTKTSAKSQH